MTNEELVRQYYDGDETALEKLYHKNIERRCFYGLYHYNGTVDQEI